MVAIAIVGVVLGGAIGGYRLKRRRDALLEKARFHESWARMHAGLLSVQMGTPLEPRLREAIDYESAMVRKYERAAWFPWLSVEPDPPAPLMAHRFRFRSQAADASRKWPS